MNQLKIILQRLKNPAVITSLVSEIIAICIGCGEETQHVIVNEKLVCKNCGHSL